MLLLAFSHFLIRDLMRETGNYYSHYTNKKNLMYKEVIYLTFPAISQSENGKLRLPTWNPMFLVPFQTSKNTAADLIPVISHTCYSKREHGMTGIICKAPGNVSLPRNPILQKLFILCRIIKRLSKTDNIKNHSLLIEMQANHL